MEAGVMGYERLNILSWMLKEVVSQEPRNEGNFQKLEKSRKHSPLKLPERNAAAMTPGFQLRETCVKPTELKDDKFVSSQVTKSNRKTNTTVNDELTWGPIRMIIASSFQGHSASGCSNGAG